MATDRQRTARKYAADELRDATALLDSARQLGAETGLPEHSVARLNEAVGRAAAAVEDAVKALAGLPAPAAEPTEAQRLAEGIICELVSEAEFDDIGDRLEDHAEGLAAIDFDQLRRNVADLISKATVTVTWPQDAEQAGDA